MKAIITLILGLVLAGCINSSTSFAFRSVSYLSTPQIEHGRIEEADTYGDNTINADKPIEIDTKIPLQE